MGGRGKSYSLGRVSRLGLMTMTPDQLAAYLGGPKEPKTKRAWNLVNMFGSLANARAAVHQVYRGIATPLIKGRVDRMPPALRGALLKGTPLPGSTPGEKPELPPVGPYRQITAIIGMPTRQTGHVRMTVTKKVPGKENPTVTRIRVPTLSAIPGAQAVIHIANSADIDSLVLHRKAKAAEPRARREMAKLKRQTQAMANAYPGTSVPVAPGVANYGVRPSTFVRQRLPSGQIVIKPISDFESPLVKSFKRKNT